MKVTEKVKITAEQAAALKVLTDTEKWSHESIISVHVSSPRGWNTWNGVGRLNGMPLLTLVDALRIGYEVEPEYEVGDWVVFVGEHLVDDEFPEEVVKIIAVRTSSNQIQFSAISGWQSIENVKRLATPEEIKTEKERRWWAEQGRGVWELKQGDVLMATGREIYEVTADPKSHRFNCYTGNDSYDFDTEECKRDNWEVICFREDRKDA